jgi:hydrogenase-4 component B
MDAHRKAPQACDISQAGRERILDRFTTQSTILVISALVLLGMFIAASARAPGFLRLIDHIDPAAAFAGWLHRLSAWPLLVIATPLVGGFAQLAYGDEACHRRDMIVISSTFATFAMVLLMYPVAADGGLSFALPGFIGLGLSFRVDMLGMTMLLVTSFLWFLVMVYAHDYLLRERHCNRFCLFMAITYSGVLGTVMAGDLLTMFLFLELMTFASYMLVTHAQSEESFEAGYNYIFMGLLGGFAIIPAMFLLHHHLGDLSFASAIVTLDELGAVRYWIIGLLFFGFGVKAGMAPVHVWLPRAHPVAPTPASALLSGVMIKVGAFGILRVATSYYFPAAPGLGHWETSVATGAVMIWLGIATMALGVFFALQQGRIKRMLAYHSISQMGYIVMGIGVALYLGEKGAMGFAGAAYHIVNHALFKSLLFMVAGAVYLQTREADMYKLGGLWRKMPVAAAVCLVASFGISGIPLFNGFISKSILHHGIVEAYQYGHASFRYAEWMFNIISAGTVCSFIKLFYYVFLREPKPEHEAIEEKYTSLHTAMIAIALVIVLIGLFPRYLLDHLIVPQLRATAYDPAFVENYVVGLRFFTAGDLLSMVFVCILGALIFVTGKKFHLFHLRIPGWFKLEYMIFYPANLSICHACRFMYGEQCPIDTDLLCKTEIRGNHKVGFMERFAIMTNMLNRRYEGAVIKSDALIYTLFLLGMLVFMAFVP